MPDFISSLRFPPDRPLSLPLRYLEAYAEDEAFCQSMRAATPIWPQLHFHSKIGLDIRCLYRKYYDLVWRQDPTGFLKIFTGVLERRWPYQGVQLVAPPLTPSNVASRVAHTSLVVRVPLSSPLVVNVIRKFLDDGKADAGYSNGQLTPDVILGFIGKSFHEALVTVLNYRIIRIDGVETLRMTIWQARSIERVDIVLDEERLWRRWDVIEAYASLCPRTLPACVFALQYWLRTRGWSNETMDVDPEWQMSSYTVAVLVVAFLQGSKRLPNLHKEALVKAAMSLHFHTAEQSGPPPCAKAGYVAPMGREAQYFDVLLVTDRMAGIFPKGGPPQLSPLQDWLASTSNQGAILHPESRLLYSSGLDRFSVEEGSVQELGHLFVELLLWLSEIFKPYHDGRSPWVVDVPWGGTRPLAEHSDPLAWHGERYTIVDPTDRRTDLSVPLQKEALHRLQWELSNVIQIISETAPNCHFLTLADPQRRSPQTAAWCDDQPPEWYCNDEARGVSDEDEPM